jgi:hypothetical protein
MKTNSSGTVTWTKSLSGGGEGQISTAKVDSSGNVYVGFAYATGGRKSGVAKYDSSGTLQWQRQVNIASGNALTIDIDSSGNVYAISSDGNNLLKYNSSGTLQWQRVFTGTTIQFTGVHYDNGNVYVTGLFDTNGGIFIVKDDGSGTGTYTLGTYSITYAAGSLTDAAGGATDTTPTATASTASGTGSTSTFTDSAATNTLTSVAI